MRAVVQRVLRSSVTVDDKVTGSIEKGLMVLLGVEDDDEMTDVTYMADKITGLRIFEDEEEKMNLSIKDVGGDILAVSQFTLFGDCRKGKRPSFIKAARPEKANSLYRAFIDACKGYGVHVEEGVFQADMLVRIENDGPVTVLLDSKKLF
ncbi:D-aminoacyl-tRNA deacylase [Anaerovorax sp. IOR16]|uniref:D-aminoacyl-tRNA deacylase n=1 Tax=Anaerovorax sp. IOR16 TaxID=2773458 RepID=UPI0019D1B4FE